jgi:Domain of unknown function (DU1801)
MPDGWLRGSGNGPQSRVNSSGLVYGPPPTGVNEWAILTRIVRSSRQNGAVETIPPEALLDPHSPEHQAIANELRRLVKRTVPGAIERVRTGWGVIGYDVLVGRQTRLFAFVWPEVEHVHLAFQHGVLMEDPDGILEGAGTTKRVRWLTIRRIEDIPSQAGELVREAARLALLSRSERLVLHMDREELAER